MEKILAIALTVLLYVLVFFMGAAVGSFSLVVLRRSGRGESWVKGRSHCEACGKTLRWYELIPFFSYLCLGGKCSGCKTKIPPSHFVCETGLGIIYTIIPLMSSLGKFDLMSAETIVIYATATVFWAASVSDVLYRETNVLPMAVVGTAAGIWNAARDWSKWYIFAAFAAAIVLLEILGRKDNLLMVGMGDIYAAVCILAIQYDFMSLINVIGMACVIGVIGHLGVSLFSRGGFTVPFIPYLFAGLALDWFGVDWAAAVQALVFRLSSM